MDKISNYFLIEKSDSIVVVSNRIPIVWKEILLVCFSLVAGLYYITGIVGAIAIGLVGSLAYLLFRFSAWIFYKEIVLRTKENRLELRYKRLSQITKNVLVSKEVNKGKWHFKEMTRSGKTKYLLQFENYKMHDLLILKREVDKEMVKEVLDDGPL